MTIYVFKSTEVTDVDVDAGVPTNMPEKTFQLVANINPSFDETMRAIAVDSALSVTARIEGSNDRQHWQTVYAPMTLVKDSGDESASAFWPADLGRMWAYHRVVFTNVDDGLEASVYMCMAGSQIG